jgi:hypothetical protein
MHYAMNVYKGVDVEIHIFLTLTLGRGEWSASRHGIYMHLHGVLFS